MPGLIFLVIFLIAIMAAASWLDANPGSAQLFIFLGYIGIAFAVYRKFQRSSWLFQYKMQIDREKDALEAAKALNKRLQEEAKQAAEWGAYQQPTAAQFLAETIAPPDAPLLTRDAHSLLSLLCIQHASYDCKTIPVSQAILYYKNLKAATNKALADYTDNLPDIYKPKPTGPTPFSSKVMATEDQLAYANRALAQPFRYQFSNIFSSYREFNPADHPIRPAEISRRFEEETKDYNIRYREYKDELRQ